MRCVLQKRIFNRIVPKQKNFCCCINGVFKDTSALFSTSCQRQKGYNFINLQTSEIILHSRWHTKGQLVGLHRPILLLLWQQQRSYKTHFCGIRLTGTSSLRLHDIPVTSLKSPDSSSCFLCPDSGHSFTWCDSVVTKRRNYITPIHQSAKSDYDLQIHLSLCTFLLFSIEIHWGLPRWSNR